MFCSASHLRCLRLCVCACVRVLASRVVDRHHDSLKGPPCLPTSLAVRTRTRQTLRLPAFNPHRKGLDPRTHPPSQRAARTPAIHSGKTAAFKEGPPEGARKKKKTHTHTHKNKTWVGGFVFFVFLLRVFTIKIPEDASVRKESGKKQKRALTNRGRQLKLVT